MAPALYRRDVDTAYDADYRPDHTLLLGASLLVVLGAYVLCQLPWPLLNRNAAAKQARPPANKTQHSNAQRAAVQSPQCSQMSPHKASVAPAVSGHSDFQTAVSNKPDRAFRFRASDADDDEDVAGDCEAWVSPEQRHKLQPQQSHLNMDELEHAKLQLEQELSQQQFATPNRVWQAVEEEQQQQEEEQEQHLAQKQQSDIGWDPELLAKCAAESSYISSVDALQRSPAFRQHVSHVRGRRLNYETAESHKLRVYRALRDVDPPGFQQLFSRKDIHEYDEVLPSRMLSTVECLVTAAFNFSLLALPWLLPTLSPYTAHLAVTWIVATVYAASKGCTSLVALLINIHATEGPYNMLPRFGRLVLAAVLEAGVVVLTAAAGVVVSLAYRLLTQQRQSFGDRVMKFVPLREVVRPMHFSIMSPGRDDGGAGLKLHAGDE